MNNQSKVMPDTDRDSSNRSYNAARAEWHRHRAAVATDSSTRMLHETFVVLYRARAQCDDAIRPGAAEI